MAAIMKNTLLTLVKCFAMIGLAYVYDGTQKSQLPFAAKCLVLMVCTVFGVLGIMFLDSLKGDRKQR